MNNVNCVGRIQLTFCIMKDVVYMRLNRYMVGELFRRRKNSFFLPVYFFSMKLWNEVQYTVH